MGSLQPSELKHWTGLTMVPVWVYRPLGLSDMHTVPAKNSGYGQHHEALATQQA